MLASFLCLLVARVKEHVPRGGQKENYFYNKAAVVVSRAGISCPFNYFITYSCLFCYATEIVLRFSVVCVMKITIK